MTQIVAVKNEDLKKDDLKVTAQIDKQKTNLFSVVGPIDYSWAMKNKKGTADSMAEESDSMLDQ